MIFYRYTPVHFASMNGHVETVKLLLENTEDSSGEDFFDLIEETAEQNVTVSVEMLFKNLFISMRLVRTYVKVCWEFF